MKNKIIVAILLILLILAVSSAVYFWYASQRAPLAASQKEFVRVPESPPAAKIRRVESPGPEKIVTIEKQVIVEKLKLPDWVKDSAEKQVIATADIAPHDGVTHTVAVMDMKTGVSEIIAKQEPRAFMAFTRDTEVYVRAGYDTSLDMRFSAGARWRFVRIGTVRLGLYAEAGTHKEAYGLAGVEVSY